MEQRNHQLEGMRTLDESVRAAFEKIDDKEARRRVFRAVDQACGLLYSVQQLPQRERLSVWEITFHIIAFLTKNGQLGRMLQDFDDDVKDFLGLCFEGWFTDYYNDMRKRQ